MPTRTGESCLIQLAKKEEEVKIQQMVFALFSFGEGVNVTFL